MAIVLAQVAINAASEMPEDRMVNTFWFQTNSEPDGTDIAAALFTHYSSIDTYMSSNAVSATGHTIKMYNQDLPEPRAPFWESVFGLPNLSGAAALPAEVAVCSSFQADAVSGENQQRRRGRVYLGGWGVTANTTDGRPAPVVQTAVANAAAQLSNDINAIGTGLDQVLWIVYSRVGGTFAKVTNGWCDNAWDTQRRRGIAPSARTVWS